MNRGARSLITNGLLPTEAQDRIGLLRVLEPLVVGLVGHVTIDDGLGVGPGDSRTWGRKRP